MTRVCGHARGGGACGDGRFTLEGRSPKPYILARAAKGLPSQSSNGVPYLPSAHFGAVGDHRRFDPPNNHSTAQGYPVPPVGEGSTLRCSESPVADSYTYGVDLR